MKNQRRANYQTYLERLGDLAMFKSLDEGTCPYGFGILVSDRDALMDRLAREGIESMNLWKNEMLPDGVHDQFETAVRLADSILFLPCHQDLTSEDIRYVSETVLTLL